MRLLVVDDDDITLELIGAMLRRRGYQVDTAADGQQALDILAARAHRVVISDWEMPGLSGPVLCERIRSGDFGGYIYTILLTGRNNTGDSVTGLNAGADDFITKPVDPDQLAARVRIAEASEPACGSVRQKAPSMRPRAIGFRNCSFCASVPNFRIGMQPTELCTLMMVEVAPSPAAISSMASA